MGVAKKGRGNNFQNCSTSSKVLYGCQLVISGEKSFLARSATIIPFGPLLRVPKTTTRLNLFERTYHVAYHARALVVVPLVRTRAENKKLILSNSIGI